MAEYRVINIVYAKLQGSGATSKYYPIAMNFCIIFFLYNWHRLEGCPNNISDFHFCAGCDGPP